LRRLAAASLLGIFLAAGCTAGLAPDDARLGALERELGTLFLVGFVAPKQSVTRISRGSSANTGSAACSCSVATSSTPIS